MKKIDIKEVKFFETKRQAQNYAEKNFISYRRFYFWHEQAEKESNGVELIKSCVRYILGKKGLIKGEVKDIIKID